MKIDKETKESLQNHFEYNDEELNSLLNNPRNQKVLSKERDLQELTFIIEIVESHGCNAGHKPGDKIYCDAHGNLLTKLCPKKVCVYAISQVDKLIWAAKELIYAGIDPNDMLFKRVSCPDVGIRCGGWGNIVMELRAQSRQIKSLYRDDVVFFWRSKHPFSQWHAAEFTVDDITYNRAEQYMMAQKALLFGDNENHDKIMNSNNPRIQKSLGRKVKGFNAEIWDKKCEEIVFKANLAKFSQNEDLKQALLATKKKIIAEASPYDNIWGIGMAEDDPNALVKVKWGQNRLGKVLMRVREALKNP